MEVRFWGTRGSVPTSLTAEHVWEKVRHALEIARDKKLDAGTDIEVFMEEELPFWAKATYGTNTPCLEIRDGERFLLCDAGTGLRHFGNEYLWTYGPLPDRKIGGLGCYLIRKMADDVHYHRQGDTNILNLMVRKNPATTGQ